MQRLGAPLRQPVQRKAGAPARSGREAIRPFLVDGDDDLLGSNRHICFNPARARMTDNPAAQQWSSGASLCGLHDDTLLTRQPTQRALTRRATVALAKAFSDDDLTPIRPDL